MMRKALLLDSSYRVISFINERHALKLLWKDRVEVLATWEDSLSWRNREIIKYPATLRLKSYFRKNYSVLLSFSKRTLFMRDQNTCQYCDRKLPYIKLSIDHIIPTSFGGKTSYLNCVVACRTCNGLKGNKMLNQTRLSLKRTPYHPTLFDHQYYFEEGCWHADWNNFVNI